MPELPEVETVLRGLQPVLEGCQILMAEQRRADLRFPFPENFAARLTGRQVGPLRRRAKYILAPLDSGETLLMHLGMSGRISIETKSDAETGADADTDAEKPCGEAHRGGPNPKHTHVVLHMSSGALVSYNDPRRFGFMTLINSDALNDHRLLREIGPEPLGDQFHAEYLARVAKGRSVSLKNFLLNQKTVAGLGNIYVCEALFRAHLSPERKAAVLARKNGEPTQAAHRLTAAVIDILREAINKGGSTLRDHRLTDGSLGYFQHSFRFYGREGQPCRSEPACNQRIKRITQSGRSTFYCPGCQK